MQSYIIIVRWSIGFAIYTIDNKALIGVKNDDSASEIVVDAAISASTSVLFSAGAEYLEAASKADKEMSDSFSKTTKGNHLR